VSERFATFFGIEFRNIEEISTSRFAFRYYLPIAWLPGAPKLAAPRLGSAIMKSLELLC
jgi:hypothetical protein